MGMGGGPSVVQYGTTHTLARPKTPTRNENRTLVTARNVFCVLHSCRPSRSTLDLSHEPRLPPRPTPTLPHAPHDRSPLKFGPLRRSARAPPPPESGHHVASPPPTLLRHFCLPRRLPLAAWPPLTAALAIVAWLERSVERKKLYKKLFSDCKLLID
jgi:hypothetical protein